MKPRLGTWECVQSVRKSLYTSEFRRATQTAEPLTSQPGVLIRKEFMSGSGDFVKLLHQRHPDGVVLVVGHSNTVVDLLVALGHNPSPPIQIDEKEFDNIFVVMPRENTSPTVIRLRYGR